MSSVLITVRQLGRVFGAQDLKSRSDYQLDLFCVVPGSIPQLRLYKTNWSTSCPLGFLFCGIYLRYSITKIISMK